jgi:DNA polymerase
MRRSTVSCPQDFVPLLISCLKRLERKGIKALYLDAGSPSVAAADDSASGIAAAAVGSISELVEIEAVAGVAAPPDEAMKKTESTLEERLGEIAAVVSECTACPLHAGRTRTVFGSGNPRTSVMFIGEGPGRDEDLQGEPFVGRSGQLLTKILQAISLERKDVYITNMVKCRPPQNRDPLEEEVRRCERYLAEQIDLIRPRVICALGRIAAQWLLKNKEPLASMRASENFYRGIRVLVTYHPAALLRNPELKRDAWEDFKKLKSLIDEDGR